MQRSAKYALVAVVVITIGGIAGFWWFVLRGDAPERASLPEREVATSTTAGPGDTTGASGTAPVATGIEGSWVVRPGEEVFVGYRIQELFAGETVEKTAVGRSPAVEGTMVVEGTTVTAVDVTADLAQLSSDSDRRDAQVRTRGIETDRFPEATFVLTEPLDLGGEPTVGEAITATARGELTLHGVTRPVEVALEARWNGEVVDVVGSLPIVLADHGIEAIDNGFVAIADEGEMELQLTFARS